MRQQKVIDVVDLLRVPGLQAGNPLVAIRSQLRLKFCRGDLIEGKAINQHLRALDSSQLSSRFLNLLQARTLRKLGWRFNWIECKVRVCLLPEGNSADMGLNFWTPVINLWGIFRALNYTAYFMRFILSLQCEWLQYIFDRTCACKSVLWLHANVYWVINYLTVVDHIWSLYSIGAHDIVCDFILRHIFVFDRVVPLLITYSSYGCLALRIWFKCQISVIVKLIPALVGCVGQKRL